MAAPNPPFPIPGRVASAFERTLWCSLPEVAFPFPLATYQAHILFRGRHLGLSCAMMMGVRDGYALIEWDEHRALCKRLAGRNTEASQQAHDKS